MSRRMFCKILLVVVAIFSLLALSGVSFAQGRSADALEHVMEVQERHTEKLMAKAGVVGTAVGRNENGRHTVLVLLEKSGIAGIPKGLDGVPVQVLVTGKLLALTETTNLNPGKFDLPVPIGVSTGNVGECSSGTIGCRVTDGTNVYALSNNHVYALENYAARNSDILQPGRFDTIPQCDIGSAHIIGTLEDFVRIRFSYRARNKIDAAIALSSTSLIGNATPLDGYGTPNSTTVEATLDQHVQKYGRTTNLTKGTVTGINAMAYITYSSGTARFLNQIIIETDDPPFIDNGDSGSLLVTDNTELNPVGLLFAGDEFGTLAIANPIDLVLGAFGVTIDDGGGPEGPVADFVGSPTSGNPSLTVNFTDLSTGNITGWLWDFGHGEPSTAQNLSHTYNDLGTYTVSLTVTGPDGSDTETKVDYITVAQAGEITLTATGYTRGKGVKKVDLEWSGASGGFVDIYRNGQNIATTENDGSYTNNLGKSASGQYTYQVHDGTTWSNTATVEF